MPALLIIVIIIVGFSLLKKAGVGASLKYGRQYINKLELSRKEIIHLNSINIPWENFSFIAFCAEEVLRLYIHTVREFPELLSKKSRKREQNLVLKYCIWCVQHSYNYKIIKLKMPDELIQFITPGIKAFVDSESKKIPPLNEEQEKKLCNYDSSRWKIMFENIVASYNKNNREFYKQVLHLASYFSYTTTLRTIFNHAHQFMADKDKEISAKFHIHYLSIKSDSKAFKYLGINAKNRQLLFTNKSKEAEFNKIIEEYKKDDNLEKALKSTGDLFEIKRKEIQLNPESINKAQKEYDLAVNILSEYLTDEDVPEQFSVESLSSVEPNKNPQKNYLEEFLELFVLNDYKLNQKEVDIFAMQKGIFTSQLINNINETYYEELNDVLIDETEDSYVVNKAYYEQISS